MIVDRFEEDYVLIEQEDKSIIECKRSQVGSEVRPGDVVVLLEGIYRTDVEKTNERKQEIKRLMDSLWE